MGASPTTLRLTLHVWRQASRDLPGAFEVHHLEGISVDMSFLEMLDVLNEGLTSQGREPFCFDHDCREGICGMCSLVINGQVHGPDQEITTCQLHMRHFADGDTIVVEPFRARALPVVRDLVVDRSAFDRIIAEGGYISTDAGSAPEGNALPISTAAADEAMDAAACIGCAGCVAACPNASAMLFTAAKVSHLAQLPQGEPERERRVLAMVERMDREGFGGCTNERECQAACPKGISVAHIARLNREFLRSSVLGRS
ncbi:MAG: hypothetical protein CMJ84_08325 [Planctomycetes bacterium]|nr:hypothetical protein [Planctomycetota bacterium]